jgi:hypothetical protein
MRIWDLPPRILCRQHLLGEHRELHAIWAVLTQGKKGYSLHPETLRWKGKLKALYLRHEALVQEMGQRGYQHKSPLDKKQAIGLSQQGDFVDPVKRQFKILRDKKCLCKISSY